MHVLRALMYGTVVMATLSSNLASGLTLYQQDFDVDDTANWTVNGGPSDEAADFYYDYMATMGIPSAPRSAGGTTRGMKLTANLTDAVFSGMSVSPTGKSFTGDYSLTFDWWSNYLGPLSTGANGSTQLSEFGVLTSGTVANWPGSADGIYFAATGDGQSSSDYRAYAPERPAGYVTPPVDSIDMHANFLAGSRNSSSAYYSAAFPGGKSAPALQQTMSPLSLTQTGMTPAGSAGFTWNEVEIKKVDQLVTWIVNGSTLATVNLTEQTVPMGGSNILFGHSDTNSGISSDANYLTVQFTLIDNVRVEAILPPPNADFDDDGTVDGNDLLAWQRHVEDASGTALHANGDANFDGNIDATDLALWQGKFGGPPAAAALSAAPEPATAGLALAAMWAAAVARRRHHARLV